MKGGYHDYRDSVQRSRPVRAGYRYDRRIALSAALLALMSGCVTSSTGHPSRGLVYLFPGVEGGAYSLELPKRALEDAGVEAEIRIFDWGRPLGTLLTNLMSYEENLDKAAIVAQEIADYRTDYPDAPIDLVGYSGGGGIAVFVAESLPEDIELRNVVLAQPALSPGYDLSRALRRVTGRFVNYYCPTDRFILGWGTRTFGTMDRLNVNSAGKVGFEKWPNSPTTRCRFEQHRWNAAMAAAGHQGGHIHILISEWNREYIAPYLCDDVHLSERAR